MKERVRNLLLTGLLLIIGVLMYWDFLKHYPVIRKPFDGQNIIYSVCSVLKIPIRPTADIVYLIFILLVATFIIKNLGKGQLAYTIRRVTSAVTLMIGIALSFIGVYSFIYPDILKALIVPLQAGTLFIIGGCFILLSLYIDVMDAESNRMRKQKWKKLKNRNVSMVVEDESENE